MIVKEKGCLQNLIHTHFFSLSIFHDLQFSLSIALSVHKNTHTYVISVWQDVGNSGERRFWNKSKLPMSSHRPILR